MSSCVIVASRSAHERCTGALSSAKARFNSPVRSAQESARAVPRVIAGMMHHTMNLFSGAVKRETHELCRVVLRLRLVAGAAASRRRCALNHGAASLSCPGDDWHGACSTLTAGGRRAPRTWCRRGGHVVKRYVEIGWLCIGGL